MAEKTAIAWTDSTWTPIRARVKADAVEIARAKGYRSLIPIVERTVGRAGPHCEHASPGCLNCYSEMNNSRCLPSNGTGLPFDRRARDLVDMFVDQRILEQPLKWKTGRKIFVCSQTDLFGEFVPDELIDAVFTVMRRCEVLNKGHTFQVLTKQAKRAYDFISAIPVPRNMWLGVSAEDQPRADERLPWLVRTPVPVRFVSVEPMLGPVDLRAALPNPLWNGIPGWNEGELQWAIIGGESGPKARPFDVEWARALVRHCKAAGVATFVKQMGSDPVESYMERPDQTIPSIRELSFKDRSGADPREWPEDLRVQEFPA